VCAGYPAALFAVSGDIGVRVILWKLNQGRNEVQVVENRFVTSAGEGDDNFTWALLPRADEARTRTAQGSSAF
jgi:hypothetical protein